MDEKEAQIFRCFRIQQKTLYKTCQRKTQYLSAQKEYFLS